MRQMGNQQQE